MLVFLLLACKHVDPAPADVDGLYHFFWTGYVNAGDDQLGEAVDNAYAAMDGDNVTAVDGLTSDLTQDELAVATLDTPRDPSLAAGFYLVDVIPCSLAAIEPIVTALDQPAWFPGSYDDYDREYTSDVDAYNTRSTPTVTWDVNLSSTLQGLSGSATYHEHLSGGARYVALGDHGPTLLARTFELAPATFDDTSTKKSFAQDYQIEVFSERSPGETVHFYGLWRQVDAGDGFTSDNNLVVKLTVNALESWDEQLGADCSPPP